MKPNIDPQQSPQSGNARLGDDYDTSAALAALNARIDSTIGKRLQELEGAEDALDRLLRLAEIRGFIRALRAFDARRKNLFKRGGGFGHAVYEVEFVAQLRQHEVEEIIGSLDVEIRQIDREFELGFAIVPLQA